MEGTLTAPAPSGELHPDTPLPVGPLMVVVLGAFMAILDQSIVNVVLPKLMAVFGVSADRIEWVVTAYLLGSGVVVPVTGYLGDRAGMKRMYVFALSVFTVGSLLCALSWSNNVLIGFRALQAFGGGMIMPISMSLMYSMVPREKIGMALGLWGIAGVTGPAFGPLLGGWLTDRFTWRLIFTINVPVGIVAVILVLAVLKETPKRPHLQLDLLGTCLAAYGAFAFLLALSQGQDKGWTSLYIVTLFVTGGFAFILFVLWELRQREPIIDIRLLKNAVFSISLLGVAITVIGLFAALFLLPLFVENLLGYSPLQAGLMTMPMALVMGLLMIVSGRLFDRVGAFWPAAIGLTWSAVVIYHLHTLSLSSSYGDIETTLVLLGVGLGLCMMPISTAGLYTIPNPLVGRATALNALVRQIASSMGIAYMVYIFTSRTAFHYNWLAGTATYTSPAAARALYGMAARVGHNAAVEYLSGIALQRSAALGFDDAFVVAAVFTVAAIPLMFFLTKRRVDAARARENAALGNGRPN